MDIFRFRKFPVCLLAREFWKELKAYSKENFPKIERYILTGQLWRALDSVVLNVAEGSDHFSGIGFSKFLNTALTSLNEAVACLDCGLGWIERRDYFMGGVENILQDNLRQFPQKFGS